MNVKEIIDKCGGSLELAYRFKLHQTNIVNWPNKGIPMKYWDELIELGKLKLQDIYNANKEAKNGRS